MFKWRNSISIVDLKILTMTMCKYENYYFYSEATSKKYN